MLSIAVVSTLDTRAIRQIAIEARDDIAEHNLMGREYRLYPAHDTETVDIPQITTATLAEQLPLFTPASLSDHIGYVFIHDSACEESGERITSLWQDVQNSPYHGVTFSRLCMLLDIQDLAHPPREDTDVWHSCLRAGLLVTAINTFAIKMSGLLAGGSLDRSTRYMQRLARRSLVRYMTRNLVETANRLHAAPPV